MNQWEVKEEQRGKLASQCYSTKTLRKKGSRVSECSRYGKVPGKVIYAYCVPPH